MPELSPQIVYSPEGVLEIRKTLEEDLKDEAVGFMLHKERVDSLPGYEVIEDGLDTIVREAVSKVTYHEFHVRGHFTHNDMKTSEFPELLEECIK